MKPSNRRRSERFNPLALKRTPARAPRTALPTRRTPKSKLPFWKRLNPLLLFKQNGKFSWKKTFAVLGGGLAIFVVLIAGAFAYYVRDLPNPKKLSERVIIESTKIVDRNGTPLYNFHGEENRTLVTGDQISNNAKQATIALEDARFYQHSGYDLRGILRAVYGRLTGRRLGGGGSTITQQYVKNALLTREHSIDRKLRELILAIEIEQRYSKDEILTGYLNQISYGGNNYGIEAASQSYFGKSSKDLTISEAATLASIPQSPNYYSPFGSHTDALFARKNYTLSRMVKVGFITQEQADAAKADAPSPEVSSFKKSKDFTAQHFVFYVRQQLIDYIGGDPKEAEAKLDEAGWTVTTSLDLPTQNMAQTILAEMGPAAVKKYQASNAAMVAVDPKTGEVLAMVGSIDYEDSKSGNTNFANALLQPGSSFKPFVYATGFDPNHTSNPGTITYDLPTDFGGGYQPNNYNGKFSGPITNRNALSQSLNIPAVKNLYLAGIGDSIDTAKRLGITSLTAKPDTYGLSLVLGSGEVRPVEMASAYGTFANGGMHNQLRPVLKITKGTTVVKDFTNDAATKAIEPEVAFQINSILSDNNARSPVFGTKNSLTLPDRPVSAKSGTTQNNRDAWTVGYTPQIAVAVWVGNNEPKKTMIKGADGSFVAAPIWNRFMREYLKDKPVEQFAQPDTMKEFTFDKLSGKIPTDQSPADQHITELLAPWQIPKDYDDVHITVKIDKLTGKLATDLTPPENIELHTYFKVHSEVPDKPGWENPVQDWARANGGSIVPPTEKSDLYTEANRPTISISSPVKNATVNGAFTIDVTVGGTKPITKVEFYIDNVLISTLTAAPWSVPYNGATLASGSHIIDVTVTNEIGLKKSDEVIVTRGETDTTPPGPVTGVNHVNGSFIAGTPIKISWLNPADTDLTKVNIYQSTITQTLGALIKSVNVTPSVSSATEFAGLSKGTYYYILRTVDAVGNESPVNVFVTAQMLP